MIVIEHIKTGEKFMFPEAPSFPAKTPNLVPLGFKKSDDQTPVPLFFEDRLRWQNRSQDPLNQNDKWSEV